MAKSVRQQSVIQKNQFVRFYVTVPSIVFIYKMKMAVIQLILTEKDLLAINKTKENLEIINWNCPTINSFKLWTYARSTFLTITVSYTAALYYKMVSGRHNLKASGRSSLRRTSSSESTHTTSRSTTSNSKPKHEFYVHVQDNEWDEDSEEENATQPSKLQYDN